MPNDFVRHTTSMLGSAVREIRVEIPDSLRQAISESYERGKDARNSTESQSSTQTATESKPLPEKR